MRKIKKVKWEQDWSGHFTYLAASIEADTYFRAFDKSFGKSITQWLVIYKNGVASAWFPTSEYEKLGKYLATKALDDAYLKKWFLAFRKYSDKVMGFAKLSPKDFIVHFSEFRSVHNIYGSYQVATKLAFDFLPIGHEDIAKRLEQARKYSETFYKDYLRLMDEVARSIAHETAYSSGLIHAMNVDEFTTYIDKEILPKPALLKERVKQSGIYINRKGLHLLSTTETNELEQYWRRDISKTELRGMTAYPGVIRARCRIVHDYHKDLLQKGEILVTKMTDPYFVPIMKKASAIVTDGGGMLSHAAIVSRELRKPCIVGTKFATQILKNGDLVEVDANKGVVKILSR
jgi:phosphohistidine swiveling domain-containing protein